LLFVHTSTILVNSSTAIAKVHATVTFHVIAAVRFLHPYFTSGTLLEFATLYELYELFIIFISFKLAGKLCTAFSSVKRYHAFQTIVLPTRIAF